MEGVDANRLAALAKVMAFCNYIVLGFQALYFLLAWGMKARLPLYSYLLFAASIALPLGFALIN